MLDFLLFLTGIIIFGEASALLTGMLIKKNSRGWLNFKNLFFLISDIITGLFFLLLSTKLLFSGNPLYLFEIILIFSILSHSWREVEYIGDNPLKFCFNIPLWIVNSLKIVLLALVVSIDTAIF